MTSLPPLDEQLVLKLERRVAVEEAVDVFPGDRSRRFPLLVNKNLSNTPGEARVGSTF
jgi:hypothetical protein